MQAVEAEPLGAPGVRGHSRQRHADVPMWRRRGDLAGSRHGQGEGVLDRLPLLEEGAEHLLELVDGPRLLVLVVERGLGAAKTRTCLPHTWIRLPDTFAACGEASHATTGPMCSGAKVSKPCSGFWKIAAQRTREVMRVRARGRITFAVAPSRWHSRAADSVRCVIAALAAA